MDIKLLADFDLTYDGKPIHMVNQPRLQSLLAYLLLHRNAQTQCHHLAFTFWPDAYESQARNNLRQMLHQLRRALPNSDQFFQTDVNSIYWLPDTPYRLDVAEFEQAALNDCIMPERIRLTDLQKEQRDYLSALDSAQRLLQFDPLREETYLCLMRLFALSDNRAAALRTYHECLSRVEVAMGGSMSGGG